MYYQCDLDRNPANPLRTPAIPPAKESEKTLSGEKNKEFREKE